MKNRIIYASFGIVIASFYIFWNNYYVSNLYFLFFASLLTLEFRNIFKIKKNELIFTLSTIYLFIITEVLIFTFKLPSNYVDKAALLIICLQFFVYSTFLIIRHEILDSLKKTTYQVFISFYMIFILFQFLKVKYFYWFNEELQAVNDQQNLLMLFYAFFPFYISWVIDASGFFFGKTRGKKKLGLTVSPNKTWVGLISIFIMAPLGFYFYKYFLFIFYPNVLRKSLFNISLSQAILFSFIIAFLGLVGDLIGSLHKRGGNLKDSGNFLKGHGGFYDRIDSTIIINFFFYYAISYFHH